MRYILCYVLEVTICLQNALCNKSSPAVYTSYVYHSACWCVIHSKLPAQGLMPVFCNLKIGTHTYSGFRDDTNVQFA